MGRIRSLVAAVLGAAVVAVSAPAVVPAAAEPPAGWKLVWSDEFDGKEVDRAKWDFELGNGFYNYGANAWIAGWGNNELQYYTREPENASLEGGMLRIRARKESYNGCGYTSARLKTRKRDGTELFAKKYGRFEFRAKLPTGRGIWPALWLLPQDDEYGTWAASGEIDVMEAKGQEPSKVLGTLHYGSRWPNNAHSGKAYEFPANGTIADFHVYAVDWEPGKVAWSVDGTVYSTQSFWWSSGKVEGGKGAKPKQESDLNPWPAPFDRPFYLVVNLAVGGNFLGKPDETTKFPAEMLIDYVRVYDKVGGYADPPARGAGPLPFEK